VLILLYEKSGRLHFLLTLRTDKVVQHRGQVSLPGGEQHPGESIEATALRETEEELGVSLETVRVLGRLTPLYVPPSNYCVYPTVAFLAHEPAFRPEPDEVAEVIEVAVDTLADPDNVRRETTVHSGRTVSVPYYAAGGHRIWGATAMVLAEFLALLETP
jgi:8-oxo-dGTP pyrophosphatase MutT (NUDIX family)